MCPLSLMKEVLAAGRGAGGSRSAADVGAELGVEAIPGGRVFPMPLVNGLPVISKEIKHASEVRGGLLGVGVEHDGDATSHVAFGVLKKAGAPRRDGVLNTRTSSSGVFGALLCNMRTLLLSEVI